jgi:hypothetical protein
LYFITAAEAILVSVPIELTISFMRAFYAKGLLLINILGNQGPLVFFDARYLRTSATRAPQLTSSIPTAGSRDNRQGRAEMQLKV